MGSATGLHPICKIMLSGSNAPDQLYTDLLEVTVENSTSLPDLCTLRVHCYNVATHTFDWIDSDIFAFGNKVEVQMGYDNSATSVFVGEVTSIDVDMASHGEPTALICCLDKSHRLHRGRQNRTFVNVKDSDIVSQLAGEAGLTASDVDQTNGVHDWILQNNQTNWEFLTERAHKNGFRLWVDGDAKLHFKNVSTTPSSTVTLTWADNLRSFRPRMTASSQVDTVTVRGWDRVQKQALVGQATTANGVPSIGASADGGSAASSAYSSATMYVLDRPVFTQDEANNIAQSVMDDIGNEYVEGEGLCTGIPALVAGVMVDIENVGTKFSGTYFVTATTHSYAASEGYTTLFTISGKRAPTLMGTFGDGQHGGGRYRLGGAILCGVVTNNQDPQNLGRIKVKYPTIGDDIESDWMPVAAPMAGPGRGFYFIPEVNDEVLIGFEHGDPRRPYVLGALWNGVDTPIEGNDDAVPDSKVEHRIIKTRIGHTVLLDDTDGTGSMTMTTCNGHVLTLDDKNKNIQAKTTDGHTVTLDDQNSNITVVDKTGNNKMIINSDDNSIEFDCNGDFKVNAQGQVNIQGQTGIQMSTPSQFQASADAGMTLSTDATMSITADATLTMSSDGPMSISSDAIVSINS